MQTVLQDEDGRERQRRAAREQEQREAVIRDRDASVVSSEAERMAHAQIANKNFRRPLDYAAIMKYRAVEPGLFMLLPTDEECRAALGLTTETEALEVVQQNRTLRLKK